MTRSPARFHLRPLTWVGLATAVIGSAPLLGVIAAAKVGWLDDPNPNMTPEQVKQFYAPQHAELLNAGVGSPKRDLKAGTETIEFITNYGRKG